MILHSDWHLHPVTQLHPESRERRGRLPWAHLTLDFRSQCLTDTLLKRRAALGGRLALNQPGLNVRESDMLDALGKLNTTSFKRLGDPEINTRIAQYEMAFQMQASVPDLMDVSKEGAKTMELYGCQPGDGSFASNCLLARRLVERGVADRLARDEDVPGVVGTLMTNMAVEVALKARGVKFERAKVGDRYVLEALEKHGWILGGEGSGHLLVLDRHTTGDGIVSALQVMQALRRSRCGLAELLREVVLFPQTLLNVRLRQGSDWTRNAGLEHSRCQLKMTTGAAVDHPADDGLGVPAPAHLDADPLYPRADADRLPVVALDRSRRAGAAARQSTYH